MSIQKDAASSHTEEFISLFIALTHKNISIPTVTEAHQLSFYTIIFFWDLYLLSFTRVSFPQIIILATTTPPGESP